MTEKTEQVKNDLPATRDEKGRFVKGVSGNPKGLAPGTRQRITREKLAMEQALREYMAEPQRFDRIRGSIDRILDIVERGEAKVAVSAFKVLSDKVLPTLKPEEDVQKGPAQIHITIDSFAVKGAKPVQDADGAIDGEFTEIPKPTTISDDED